MQGANNGWVRVYIYRGCVGISALGSSERVFVPPVMQKSDPVCLVLVGDHAFYRLYKKVGGRSRGDGGTY